MKFDFDKILPGNNRKSTYSLNKCNNKHLGHHNTEPSVSAISRQVTNTDHALLQGVTTSTDVAGISKKDASRNTLIRDTVGVRAGLSPAREVGSDLSPIPSQSEVHNTSLSPEPLCSSDNLANTGDNKSRSNDAAVGIAGRHMVTSDTSSDVTLGRFAHSCCQRGQEDVIGDTSRHVTVETPTSDECQRDRCDVTRDTGPDVKKETSTSNECQRDQTDVNIVYEKDNGVPQDTGWSWIVAIAASVLFCIYQGYNNVIAVLLLDLSAELQVNIGTINAMLSICGIAYCLASLITASFLVERYSVRVLLICASIMNCGASIVIALVPFFPVFFSMNALKFLAAGMCCIPSITLVAQYFRRHRSFACSLAFMGVYFGGICLAPLTRYLKDEYGLQGCFLLLAGVEMQAVVASSVCRPLSFYKNQNGHRPTKGSSHHRTAKNKCVKIVSSKNSHSSVCKNGTMSQESSTSVNVFVIDAELEKTGNSSYIQSKATTDIGLQNTSDISYTQSKRVKDAEPRNTSDISNTQSKATTDIGLQNTSDISYIQSKHVTDAELKSTSDIFFIQSKPVTDIQTKDTSNMSCIQSELLQIRSVSSLDDSSRLSLNPTPPKEPKRENLGVTLLKYIQPVFDVKLLSKPLYVMCMTYYSLNQSGYVILTVIAAIATQSGVSATDSALLLTINGVSQIVSKVVFSLLADHCHIRPTILVKYTAVVFAIFVIFGPSMRTWELLVVLAVVHGLISDVGCALILPVIVEVMGQENLTKVMAAASFFNYIGISVQYAVIGSLIEMTGSFDPVFYYCGVTYPLAGLLIFLEPVIRRLQNRKVIQ